MLGKAYVVLGSLSVLYFLGYIIQFGFNNSFSFFFLGLGVFLIAMGTIHILSHNETIYVPRWVHGIYHVLVAISICLFAIIETLIIFASTTEPQDNADYVVVPGARVIGDRPSKNLKRRLDCAYDYFYKFPNTVFILSGGKGDGENLPEGEAMKNYLYDKGIPAEQMIIEDEAVNTKENVSNITNIIMNDSNITSHNTKKMKDIKVVVATNRFHLYRTEKLFENRGFQQVSGIGAKSKLYTVPLNYTREFFAVVWYKLQALI